MANAVRFACLNPFTGPNKSLNPLSVPVPKSNICPLKNPSFLSLRALIRIGSNVRKACPQIPLALYINGNGGLLERMKVVGVDVIGLDWTVDMADGRKKLVSSISVQGNVDPAYIFSPLPVLTDEIHRVLRSAGPRGHILNLGHGVLLRHQKR